MAQICLPPVGVSDAVDSIVDFGEDGVEVGADGVGVIPHSVGDGVMAGVVGERGVRSGPGLRIGITPGGTTLPRATWIRPRTG